MKNIVFAYDTTGKFVSRYETIEEASAALSISKSSIINCCNGKRKQCKGYAFRYNYTERVQRVKCKIGQYDLEGNLLYIYNSIREASEITSTDYYSIYRVVNNKQASSKGYVYRYYERERSLRDIYYLSINS